MKPYFYTLFIFLIVSCSANSSATKNTKKSTQEPNIRLLSYEQLHDVARISSIEQALAAPNDALKLILFRQGLLKLPESIGSLYTLNTLEITGNSIESLPDTLAAITTLQSVYASRNLLTEFPKVLTKLPNLQRVDLSENTIANFAGLEQVLSLKELDLSRIGIDEIPQELYKLSELEVFRASHNKITELDNSIGKLSRLRILNLANNKLSTLPDSLVHLKELKKLILESNLFEKEYIDVWRKKMPNTIIKY